MTGHGRSNGVELFLETRGLIPLGKVVGNIAQQRRRVGAAEQRRDLADGDSARPEGLDDETELGQLFGTLDEAIDVLFGHVDDLRDQQHLRLDALGDLPLQPFVDEALVGGVLIDDDEARLGLGNDVGLVDLGARRAERSRQAFHGNLGKTGALTGLRI